MEGISAHLVVRNEPFIYYAVMAVYPYVERILLWDTGSYDRYTLQDIQDVLKADIDKKIDYRQIEIQTDETDWNINAWRKARAANAGKIGVGHVRQWQIDETHTRFFLIVDGDEVHYSSALQAIRKHIAIWHIDPNFTCAGVPLRWFDTPKSWFQFSRSGRVFRTSTVQMMKASPGEMHCLKGTNKPLEMGAHGRVNIEIEPYAHFEKMLKPWRRTVDPKTRQRWGGDWPDIIQANPYYFERFMRECFGKTKAQMEAKPK